MSPRFDHHSGNMTKKYSLVFLLWLLFSAACFLAPWLAIFFHFSKDGSYSKRVVQAADRMIAAILGFSGRFTLSAELAHAEERKYKRLHDVLNEVIPEHCESEAVDEGLYCRISDRKLGRK